MYLKKKKIFREPPKKILCFHRDTADLNVFNFISVSAENSGGAFGIFVYSYAFSFWNQFFIGSKIFNVIIGLDDSKINARSGSHVIDNTSGNSVTDQFFCFLFAQFFFPIFFKNRNSG